MSDAWRVLSLGAGVQSTALLLMSLAGELPPLDVAVFADTQSEPEEVYDHLGRLEVEAKRQGLPVVRVTAGNLEEASLGTTNKMSVPIPAFIRGDDGQPGITHRVCTERFKIRPIRRWLQEHREGRHVVQSIGISLDEVQRMRPARDSWATNVWPLVDARRTRHDCLRWLDEHGWSAPRSACYFCPFKSNDEWRRLREQPEEWAKAVHFDVELRRANEQRRSDPEVSSLRHEPYLHRSLRPLSEVDLSTPEENGQGSLFDMECEGMCGV